MKGGFTSPTGGSCTFQKKSTTHHALPPAHQPQRKPAELSATTEPVASRNNAASRPTTIVDPEGSTIGPNGPGHPKSARPTNQRTGKEGMAKRNRDAQAPQSQDPNHGPTARAAPPGNCRIGTKACSGGTRPPPNTRHRCRKPLVSPGLAGGHRTAHSETRKPPTPMAPGRSSSPRWGQTPATNPKPGTRPNGGTNANSSGTIAAAAGGAAFAGRVGPRHAANKPWPETAEARSAVKDKALAGATGPKETHLNSPASQSQRIA